MARRATGTLVSTSDRGAEGPSHAAFSSCNAATSTHNTHRFTSGGPAALPRRSAPVPATAAAASDAGPSEPPSAASAAADEGEEWVEVGIVGPTHGVRGEFRVQPLTDFPKERFGKPGPRWLQPLAVAGRLGRQPPTQMELEWGRPSVSKVRSILSMPDLVFCILLAFVPGGSNNKSLFLIFAHLSS
jgi:hypothetical protein